MLVRRGANALVAATVLSSLLLSSPGHAGSDRKSVVENRFMIDLGAYFPDFSTDAVIGREGRLIGSIIRLESDLGLENDASAGRLEGYYRFKPKHAIDWQFLTLSRSGSSVLDQEIVIKDRIFQFGADTDSSFDSQVYRIAYRYSFFQNEKINTGISVGLGAYGFELALAGEAILTDDEGGMSTAEFVRVEENITVPVPTFGVFINYAVRKDLMFAFNLNFLDLEVGDFEGRLVDSDFALSWYFSKHVGIGVEIASTNIEVRVTSGDNPFFVDYRYSGLAGFLSITF